MSWQMKSGEMGADLCADRRPRELFNDKFTTQTSGGFVVYYVSDGKNKVTAFKPVS